MSNGKAKQRTQVDLSDVHIRLPLNGTYKKPIIDGNNLYISNIDPEKLKSVIAFFTKSRVGDNTGPWLRFEGYDHIGQKPAISSEEMDEHLQQKLEMVTNMNPLFLDNPILKELLQEIFDQKPIIAAVQNGDLSEMGRSLETYTYGIMSVISKLVVLVDEANKKDTLVNSAVAAIEHMPEDEANVWYVHAQAMQNYHARVNELFKFQRESLTSVKHWLDEKDKIVDRRMVLMAEYEELSIATRKVALSTSYTSQEVSDVSQGIEKYLTSVAIYNDECEVVSCLATELKSHQKTLTELLRVTLLAYKTLDSYKDQKGFSNLVLNKWVSDDVYHETMQWAKEEIHQPKAWEDQLVGLRGQIDNSEGLLELIDPKKAQELLLSLPVIETDEEEEVKEETGAFAFSSVPLPSTFGVFGGVTPAPKALPEPVVVSKSNVDEKPSVKKPAPEKSKNVRDKFKEKLSEQEVNPDLPIPRSNRDLLELCILAEAAKQKNANPLRGGTIGTFFSTLIVAGFDLQYVNQQSFRDYLENSPEVEAEVGRVESQHEVKFKYAESRKKLLVYTIDKGTTPASKFRTKITRVHSSHETTLKRSEQAWGITRAELASYASERKELLNLG